MTVALDTIRAKQYDLVAVDLPLSRSDAHLLMQYAESNRVHVVATTQSNINGGIHNV
jgi:MinD superfamily P-loop ATPase